MDNMYYKLEGKVAVAVSDTMEWAKCFEADNRHVDLTEMDNVYVSTVFLGINHQYGEGPPLLFETMVFGGVLDQEQDRYSTWDEAVIGHKNTVERVKAAEIKDFVYV